MYVPGKLFNPILTNALAYYENSYITDKKFYIIGSGDFDSKRNYLNFKGFHRPKGGPIL
jgi:hypothetical protein